MEQFLIALVYTSPWYIFAYLIYRGFTTIYRDGKTLLNGDGAEITKFVNTRVKSERGNAEIILSLQDIVFDVLREVKKMVNEKDNIG